MIAFLAVKTMTTYELLWAKKVFFNIQLHPLLTINSSGCARKYTLSTENHSRKTDKALIFKIDKMWNLHFNRSNGNENIYAK